MQKIAICGDQHWTFARPENRTDNYAETVIQKLQWQIDTAIENSCDYIIFPGDLFDSHKVPYGVLTSVLAIMNATTKSTYHTPPYFMAVYGQHDQRYHSTEKHNTPLGALLEGTPNAMCLGSTPWAHNGIHFYGASWGEDIPEIQETGVFNVLVTHRMVIGDAKLWEEQTEYVTAKGLLKDTPFNLIITGDNHNRVIQQDIRRRALVNMGSLMRSTVAQIDHIPAMCIFDVESKTYEIKDIPIAPARKVFNVEKVEQKKEQDSRLSAFVQGLKENTVQHRTFAENLQQFCANNTVPPLVQGELEKMLPTTIKMDV